MQLYEHSPNITQRGHSKCVFGKYDRRNFWYILYTKLRTLCAWNARTIWKCLILQVQSWCELAESCSTKFACRLPVLGAVGHPCRAEACACCWCNQAAAPWRNSWGNLVVNFGQMQSFLLDKRVHHQWVKATCLIKRCSCYCLFVIYYYQLTIELKLNLQESSC